MRLLVWRTDRQLAKHAVSEGTKAVTKYNCSMQKTAEPDESDQASDEVSSEMNGDEIDSDDELQSQGRAADAQTRSQRAGLVVRQLCSICFVLTL